MNTDFDFLGYFEYLSNELDIDFSEQNEFVAACLDFYGYKIDEVTFRAQLNDKTSLLENEINRITEEIKAIKKEAVQGNTSTDTVNTPAKATITPSFAQKISTPQAKTAEAVSITPSSPSKTYEKDPYREPIE